jgi:hypothetical protein
MLPRDGDSDNFMAGDERCNEQSGLICMHTLFMREHNRIAARLANDFPAMSDEELFQNARKEVIAILQSITYNEFLPLLLGPSPLDEYQGYQSQVCPDIANVFSTSAYRFGHSMLNSNLLRLDNQGNVIPEGNLPLGLSFFNPNVVGDLGIEPYLKGLITQIAQECDTRLIGDVRNFLFGQPGSGGFDLAALNIQRGRDHGLPDYNTIRAGYELPRVTSFVEITSDVQLQNDLQSVYDNVDEIDPWTGMLAEDHVPDAIVGVTAYSVIKDQFERIRDADRFWYQIQFEGAQLEEIENTRLSDVILRNTSLTTVQPNVFVAGSQPVPRR